MRKRIFDLIFVILLSPLILFIFFITFLFALIFNRKNIFFFQSRGGYKGEKIEVIKFRTMENQTHKISNFNNFLRKSRLDEIPQFLNVLKGDLSIVGPRPLHYEYKEIYSSEQKKIKCQSVLLALKRVRIFFCLVRFRILVRISNLELLDLCVF